MVGTKAATVVAVSTAALFAAQAPPARAAIRYCQPMLVGAEKSAANEIDAKRLALDNWTASVKALGENYSAWRLANNKAISCRIAAAGETGVFICQARASPCAISQTSTAPPYTQPPQQSPAPARTPGGKAMQI